MIFWKLKLRPEIADSDWWAEVRSRGFRGDDAEVNYPETFRLKTSEMVFFSKFILVTKMSFDVDLIRLRIKWKHEK